MRIKRIRAYAKLEWFSSSDNHNRDSRITSPLSGVTFLPVELGKQWSKYLSCLVKTTFQNIRFIIHSELSKIRSTYSFAVLTKLAEKIVAMSWTYVFGADFCIRYVRKIKFSVEEEYVMSYESRVHLKWISNYPYFLSDET